MKPILLLTILWIFESNAETYQLKHFMKEENSVG